MDYTNKFLLAGFQIDLDGIKEGIKNEVYIDSCDDFGNTALQYASRVGDKEVVEFLLNNGALRWLRTKNNSKNGMTSEDVADSYGKKECLELLKNFKVDDFEQLNFYLGDSRTYDFKKKLETIKNINITDNDGNTLLHCAAKKYNNTIGDILMAAGIDKTIKNKDGKIAMDFCVPNGNLSYILMCETINPSFE